MAGLAQLPAITPQSVWGRGVHHYVAARNLVRGAEPLVGPAVRCAGLGR